MCDPKQTQRLLDWYDQNARHLAWRVSPSDVLAGVIPDPYRVWLSEIMLQQTTVAAVDAYFRTFVARWPDIYALAHAKDDDVMAAWAGLGYYARARNLLKCARQVVEKHSGIFPNERTALLALPGIGPYTAAAVGAIAFGRQEVVVDGNVERVMSRMYAVTDPLPSSKPKLTQLAEGLTPHNRPGDYAQAVMDLGATVCTVLNPTCPMCPWRGFCKAHAAKIQNTLPRKIKKAPKPVRQGFAYVAQRPDGSLLMERRPDTGLLGGMLCWPGSDWSASPTDNPPIDAIWHSASERVRHTFTHFHLNLTVKTALVTMDDDYRQCQFISPEDFDAEDLPTVMKKVYHMAKSNRPTKLDKEV